MTSSMIPSPRRPSVGASFDSRSNLGCPSASDCSASLTTTGWAQLPPTQPSIVPSGWTIPVAPGRAEVGRATATTVATTNGRPDASREAARPYKLWVTMKLLARGTLGEALLVEDRPDLR